MPCPWQPRGALAQQVLSVWDAGKGEDRRKGLLFNADGDKGRMRLRKHELCKVMGGKDRIQWQWGCGCCRRSQPFRLNWGRWEEFLIKVLGPRSRCQSRLSRGSAALSRCYWASDSPPEGRR